MSKEHLSECQECGASIYPEHLDTGIARYEAGKLMCVHCVEEYEAAHDAVGGQVEAEETMELVEESEESAMGSRVHHFTDATMGKAHGVDESKFKRPLDPASAGATRCRVFHSKLNEGAIEYMTNAINEWVDGHDDIVVKFATSTIGVFEGKHSDPNLIMTLYY